LSIQAHSVSGLFLGADADISDGDFGSMWRLMCAHVALNIEI